MLGRRSISVLFLWSMEREGLLEIAIQSRGHICMLNCPQEGLIPLPFYRGKFSLPRLPSVLEHMGLLSLQCPPCKLLSLRHLPCSVSFAQGCTPCPVVLFAQSWTPGSLAGRTVGIFLPSYLLDKNHMAYLLLSMLSRLLSTSPA